MIQIIFKMGQSSSVAWQENFHISEQLTVIFSSKPQSGKLCEAAEELKLSSIIPQTNQNSKVTSHAFIISCHMLLKKVQKDKTHQKQIKHYCKKIKHRLLLLETSYEKDITLVASPSFSG